VTRDKRTPLAIAALAVLAAAFLAVPSALAASVTPANGHDFILPNGNVYQLGPLGQFHLIPDVATANAMKLNWNTLSATSSISPIGAPLASVLPAPATSLPLAVKNVPITAKANGADYVLPNGAVFQKDANGYFHWIPNVFTANQMNINWKTLIQVNSVGLVGPAMPTALLHVQPAACSKRVAPAAMANGKDVIVPPNPGVYQQDANGVYHLIPDRATADAMGIKWSQLKKVGYVAPLGKPYPTVCAG